MLEEQAQPGSSQQLADDDRRLILEVKSHAVFALSPAGQILSWNNGAELLKGYSASEIIGQPFSVLFTDEDVALKQPQAELRLAAAEGQFTGECWRRRRDGSRFWASVALTALHDATGALRGFLNITRDITAHRQTREELQYQLRVTGAITNNAAEGLCLMDVMGRLTFMNPAAEEILGWRREELTGRILHDTVHHRRPDGTPFPAHECPMVEVLKSGTTVSNREDAMIRADGSFVPVFCSCAPITVDGEITGAVLALHDITERKRIEAELREQAMDNARLYREAQEANRIKDEFLATLSHELRTPLTAVLGWAKLLSTGQLDAEASARAVDTIRRNARAQQQIIEDILDVSRIITGKIRLEVVPVELVPVIEAAMEAVRPAADAKAIRLELALGEETGPVRCDPARLQQVIWNLLTNAVKFTPQGGRIELGLREVDAHLQLTVTDTGMGIRAEFLPFVFDRFRQADGSTTRLHGGLGLGLAIVRHLVELHGGTVSAGSGGEGKGATFIITLPLSARKTESEEVAEASMHIAPAEPETSLLADLSGLRVLVVDDEADSLEFLHISLTGCGAEVCAVSSVAEALAALSEFRPDVLVSDIGMPHEDGYTLMRKVRARSPEQGGTIPAAAVTAYARTEDRTRALLAGFQSHLAKPVEPAELVAVVASLAGRTTTE